MRAVFSLRRIIPALILTLLPLTHAHASCGASYCTVNTQWQVQGVWNEPGLRLDLRQEFIDQDQTLSRDDKVAIGAIHKHHDEVRTINRNTLLTLDYGFSPEWGVALTLPWVNRDHFHIHNHHGVPIDERWHIDELGDVRLLGRFQPESSSVSWLFGIKLPTGEIEFENENGDEAERSLQPGTGTSDVLLGAAWRSAASGSALSWFAQGLWQKPLAEHRDYRAGYQLGLDGGLRYAATPHFGFMAQLNGLWQDRERGRQGEPADSGKRAVFFSPGVSLALGEAAQAYVFLQQPLYHRVNGVQLTADQAWAAGLSLRF
jgi:hypothetical protein